MTMLKLYEDFGLDENTQSFTGHAMALQRDDSYLNKWVFGIKFQATLPLFAVYTFTSEKS